MFCSNCGSRIPDGSNFCTKCGKKQNLGNSGNTQDQSRVDQTVYNQSVNRGSNHYHSASFSEAEDRYQQSKGGNRNDWYSENQQSRSYHGNGQSQYNGQSRYSGQGHNTDINTGTSAGMVVGIIIAVLVILVLILLAVTYPSYYENKKQNEMIEESLQNDGASNDNRDASGEERLTTSTREAQTYESEESTEESTEYSDESTESSEEPTEISDESTESLEATVEESTGAEESVVSEFNAVKDQHGGLVVHGNSDDMDGSISKSSQSLEEFKASCKVYNYEDLIRYSDSYVGEPIKVTVKVSNKFNDPEYYWSCNAATSTGWYGDSYTLNYNSEPKLVQGDVVVAYGTYMGSIDTWTVLNVRNEVPTIDVVCIDILTEDEANDIIQDMWNAEFNSYQ